MFFPIAAPGGFRYPGVAFVLQVEMNAYRFDNCALDPRVFNHPQEFDQAVFRDGSNLVGEDYGISSKAPHAFGYQYFIGVHSPPFFREVMGRIVTTGIS